MEQQSQKQNNNFITDENRGKASKPPNVWIVTLPFFTHVLSAAQFAQLVATYGLSVTLFAALADIQRLERSSNRMVDNWKREGLDIKLQSLGFNSAVLGESVGQKGQGFIEPFSRVHGAFEEFLKSKIESGSKPTCVISDFGVPAILVVAARYKIPSLAFIPLSISYVTTFLYLRQLSSLDILKLPSSLSRENQETLISVPGLPLMRFCDLSSLHFKHDLLYEYSCTRLQPLRNSEVIILSSFRELEPRALQELQKLLKDYASTNSKKMPHLWTIGPSCPFLAYSKRSSEKSDENAEVDPCIRFLDSQPPRSVVYVAFGTDVNLYGDQILELVYGLESSQQPFLCALHPPKKNLKSDVQVEDIMSIIPPDCLERIKSRSLIVDWAPQMEVLSHPSTGAFISHCGFNSLLESVSLGVPILTWPVQFEQFMNCRLLVDEARIALEVCPGMVPGGFVTKKDVEKSITTLFHSDEGRAIRDRALEMKQQAEETVGENGSSTQNILDLVAFIRSLPT